MPTRAPARVRAGRKPRRKSLGSRRVAWPAATKSASGVRYYGRRYYDPSNGRFVGRDPIEEDGGLNLYGFCGNNGVNRWDYLGMDDFFIGYDPAGSGEWGVWSAIDIGGVQDGAGPSPYATPTYTTPTLGQQIAGAFGQVDAFNATTGGSSSFNLFASVANFLGIGGTVPDGNVSIRPAIVVEDGAWAPATPTSTPPVERLLPGEAAAGQAVVDSINRTNAINNPDPFASVVGGFAAQGGLLTYGANLTLKAAAVGVLAPVAIVALAPAAVAGAATTVRVGTTMITAGRIAGTAALGEAAVAVSSPTGQRWIGRAGELVDGLWGGQGTSSFTWSGWAGQVIGGVDGLGDTFRRRSPPPPPR